MQFTPGLYLSPGDPRDFLYRSMVPPFGLPVRFSRRSEFAPTRNQGQYGTCVGFATAAVKDNQEARNYPGRGIVLSPLHLYALCKAQDGIPDKEGTYPRVAMQVLHKAGICQEEILPYSRMSWPKLPEVPNEANTDGQQFKIGAYARLQTLDEVKQAIVRDGPVLAGILVCENFMHPTERGIIDMPSGRILGGHAICVMGYDDTMTARGHTGFLEVRNSWGPDWGDAGYCWIPYDFFGWRADMGYTAWLESWSSVDVVLPPEAAREVILWIDKPSARVDGREVPLDQPPAIDPRSNRTLVPLRFIAENFGCRVEWDGAEKKIRLTR
jgi:C1A family cysteine protease